MYLNFIKIICLLLKFNWSSFYTERRYFFLNYYIALILFQKECQKIFERILNSQKDFDFSQKNNQMKRAKSLLLSGWRGIYYETIIIFKVRH
jgi:hypothetical protein